MQAHPDADLGVFRPRRSGERALRIDCRRYRQRRRSEDRKERIALRADFGSAASRDGSADQVVVCRQKLVETITEAVCQPGRAFDVGKQEGDGAGWKLAPCHRRLSPRSAGLERFGTAYRIRTDDLRLERAVS